MQPAKPSPVLPQADRGGIMPAVLAPAPKSPVGPAPERVADSIRRTSTIDVDWPEGQGTGMRAKACARDLVTTVTGEPIVLAEDRYEASLDRERRVLAMAGAAGLGGLVGERAGARLRAALKRDLPELKEAGAPLYLVLDDLAGASLVAPWAWSCWDPHWYDNMARMKADPQFAANFDRENICAGLRTGSSGLSFGASGAATGDLRNPRDPSGWHDFPDLSGTAFRRARRIDVRLGKTILIDSHFQDSASRADGKGRYVVHEYSVRASADPVSRTLLSIEAEPRVLPFPECVAAAPNVARLIGAPLSSLRELVLVELARTAGCTHLNDALRALAEVPVLVNQLRTTSASE